MKISCALFFKMGGVGPFYMYPAKSPESKIEGAKKTPERSLLNLNSFFKT
jgi:hypothetical protein